MTWVEAERPSFAGDFRAADPDAPTLCAGWSARHLCAHLVQREHSMLRNIWDQVTTRTPGEERFMRRLVDDAGTPDGYAALVDRFEAGPSRHSLMGRFDEALNLVEYVVHHEDLRRGSGPVPPRDLPAAELDEIWRRARLILKRAYRKAPVGVELAPDGGAVIPVHERAGSSHPGRFTSRSPPARIRQTQRRRRTRRRPIRRRELLQPMGDSGMSCGAAADLA